MAIRKGTGSRSRPRRALGARRGPAGGGYAAAIDLAPYAWDPDQDPLTFRADPAFPLPDGLQVQGNFLAGTVTYAAAEHGRDAAGNPTTDGNYTVQLIADDGYGGTASARFHWSVWDVNRPPVITDPGPLHFAEEAQVDLTIQVADPDQDDVDFTIDIDPNSLPLGLTIPSPGVIRGTIDRQAWEASYGGHLSTLVTATDEHFNSTTLQLDWTIDNVNAPPQVTSFRLFRDTGDPDDKITADACVWGTVIDPDDPIDNLTGEIDTDSDGVPDLTVPITADFQLVDLAPYLDYGTHTVQARASEPDGIGGTIAGAWVPLTFTFRNDPPQIATFTLLHDTGTPDDHITADATLTGTVLDDTALDQVFIEFNFEDDLEPDGTTPVDADGHFALDPSENLYVGPWTILARPGAWDNKLGEYIYGDWKTLAFEFRYVTLDSAIGLAWEGDTLHFDFSAEAEIGYVASYAVDINRDGVFDLEGPHDPILDGVQFIDVPMLDLIGTPADDGTYIGTVRVTTDVGKYQDFDFGITVGNVPTTIALEGLTDLLPGGEFSLTVNTSDPGPDTVASLQIDWGDGASASFSVSAGVFSHVYSSAGIYTVTVTSADEDEPSTATTIVRVAQPPASLNVVSAVIDANGLLEVHVAAEDVDGNPITNIAWDTDGDGAFDDANGSIVVLAPDQSLPSDGGTDPTGRPRYAAAVEVTDSAGGKTQFLIGVWPPPPTVAGDPQVAVEKLPKESGPFDWDLFWYNVELFDPELADWFRNTAGGRVEQRSFWWFNTDFQWTGHDAGQGGRGTNPLVMIKKSLNERDAAEAFVAMATDVTEPLALRFQEYVLLSGLAGPDGGAGDLARFQQYVQRARNQYAAAGAERYLDLISVVNDGVDVIVTINAVVNEQDYLALAAFLPLVSRGSVKFIAGGVKKVIPTEQLYQLYRAGGKLRYNVVQHLKAFNRVILKGYVVHHIIPVVMIKRSEFVREAVRRNLYDLNRGVGYDINHIGNAMLLPDATVINPPRHLPVHSGGHHKAYFDWVEAKLESVQDEWKAANRNWSDTRIRQELGRIEAEVASDIMQRRIQL